MNQQRSRRFKAAKEVEREKRLYETLKQKFLKGWDFCVFNV